MQYKIIKLICRCLKSKMVGDIVYYISMYIMYRRTIALRSEEQKEHHLWCVCVFFCFVLCCCSLRVCELFDSYVMEARFFLFF